jgi:hypothetical protein
MPCQRETIGAAPPNAGARFILDTEPRPRAAAKAWWSPPAGCRSPRSAPRGWAYSWPAVRPAIVPHTPGPGAAHASTPRTGRPTRNWPAWPAGAIATGRKAAARRFREDLLFTHRGLSGPAVLQISSYWQPGTPIGIDLAPGVDLLAELQAGQGRARAG